MNKKTALPTVTVGVPAYNEEANIGSLLKSVLAQKVNFEFEIIIISDGSSDQTVNEVRKVKDERIKLYADKTRRGKAYRMNQLIARGKGDVIVFIDADVQIRSRTMLSEVVSPFYRYKNIGLVGGNVIPQKGKSLLQKSIISSVNAYDKARLEVKNGNNVYSCKGPLIALSKLFAQKLKMPSNISGDDTYIYFRCKSLGFRFIYNDLARVYQKVPSSIADHINQNSRSISSITSVGPQFSDIYLVEKKLMRNKLYKYMFLELIKHPFRGIYIFILNVFARLKSLFSNQGNAIWTMVTSTK